MSGSCAQEGNIDSTRAHFPVSPPCGMQQIETRLCAELSPYLKKLWSVPQQILTAVGKRVLSRSRGSGVPVALGAATSHRASGSLLLCSRMIDWDRF